MPWRREAPKEYGKASLYPPLGLERVQLAAAFDGVRHAIFHAPTPSEGAYDRVPNKSG
jgi:hypothetical protein